MLLDSRASGCAVSRQCVKESALKNAKPAKWTTQGGTFTTSHTAKVELVFPELDPTKIVNWKFHVDDSETPNPRYDLIIGRDLLTELGIVLNFANQTISCHGGAYEGCHTSMVDIN